MANTKKLPREQRKFLKRRQRRDHKKLFASLTSRERREFAESEKKSLKAFLKEKGRP